MAVISPSADMRFRVMRAPTRTPSGMVNVNVNGTDSANSSATVAGGAELRMSVSKSLLTRCRNRTNVNSTVPSTELVRTSRNIDLLRIPMTLARLLLGLCWWRRYDGEARHLIHDLLELQ